MRNCPSKFPVGDQDHCWLRWSMQAYHNLLCSLNKPWHELLSLKPSGYKGKHQTSSLFSLFIIQPQFFSTAAVFHTNDHYQGFILSLWIKPFTAHHKAVILSCLSSLNWLHSNNSTGAHRKKRSASVLHFILLFHESWILSITSLETQWFIWFNHCLSSLMSTSKAETFNRFEINLNF